MLLTDDLLMFQSLKTIQLLKHNFINMNCIVLVVDVCGRLVFPWRTFYCSCDSEADMQDWMRLIQWLLVSVFSPLR